MKNVFALFLSLLPFLLTAQNTEGKITFTETVQLDIKLPEGMEHMKDKLPSSQSAEKELLFNATSSLWRNAEAVENEEATTIEDTNEEANFTIKVRVASSESELYKGFDTGAQIEKQDFMGKIFLINGSIRKYPWKLTGAQKSIAGYDCQQAIFEGEEEKVEAWFSPQIPVSSGPECYGALPGMVLEINIDEGRTVISANKVNFMQIEEGTIVAPKKGKKISQEEFDAIVETKTKEMGERTGGNVIRMRRGE